MQSQLREAFIERRHRLWFSGTASSELEVTSKPWRKWREVAGEAPPQPPEPGPIKEVPKKRRALIEYANGRPSMGKVTLTVAEYSGCEFAELRGLSRKEKIIYWRHIAQWIAYKYSNRYTPEIGRYFGRDHSTITYAHQKISAELPRDENLAQEVAEILEKLGCV